MIKMVKKYAREAREFVQEEVRRNGVSVCRADDWSKYLSWKRVCCLGVKSICWIFFHLFNGGSG